MIIYALKIKSFPKIKGAFSEVGRDCRYSTGSRKGELEIACVNGIEYTVKIDDYERKYRDGEIFINMPDTGFFRSQEYEKEYVSANVVVELDDYECKMYNIKSKDDWESVKAEATDKILVPIYIPKGKESSIVELGLNRIIMNEMKGSITTELENVGVWCSVLAIIDSYARGILDDKKNLDEDVRAAYVRKIRAYVDSHYAEKIKLADVAKSIKASSGYTGKLIKKATGKTFAEYVNFVRIENARKIFIKEQNITAEKVAEMVGFCDERYMNIVCKRLTGFNVRECRKMDAISLPVAGNQFFVKREEGIDGNNQNN